MNTSNATSEFSGPRTILLDTLDSFFHRENIRTLAGVAGTERRSSQRDGGYPVLRVNSLLLPQEVPSAVLEQLVETAHSRYTIIKPLPDSLHARILFHGGDNSTVSSQISFAFMPFLIADIVEDIFTGGRRTGKTYELFKQEMGLKTFSYFDRACKQNGAYVVFDEELDAEKVEFLVRLFFKCIPDISVSFLESASSSRFGPTILISSTDGLHKLVFPLSMYYGGAPFEQRSATRGAGR